MPMMKYRYSAVAIALHWIIALAILGMIALGWYMGDLPNDAANKADLYQLHKSIGVSILVLTIARILWRIMNKPPEELPMEHKQALAAKAVHIGFYALMILMPLTGWILVSASTRGFPTVLFDVIQWPHLPFLPDLSADTKKAIFPVLENAHGKLAWVAIVLLALHVLGALKHQFVDKDGLLARMLPGIFGATDGPQYTPKGLAFAFGGALLFFAAIVGAGALFSKADAQPKPDRVETTAATITPNWAIDYAASEIKFSGVYNKKPFEGVFKDWTADIEYRTEALEDAAVKVVVQTASATTGDNYSDTSLTGPDFFNVKEYPQAIFTANGVFPTEEGLELTAVLNLKGQDYPIRMPFDLILAENTAVMTATFKLDRVALGLGVENDPKAEWISKDIDMDVKLVATTLE